MTEKKKPTGDYTVGYARPPKEHQIKKGERQNPKGRPKSKKSSEIDISALLDEPVKVMAGGKERDMSPFEASLRQQAKRALAGHLPSIIKFVKICEEYGVIALPLVEEVGGVLVAPKGVNFNDWFESVTEEVPALTNRSRP